VRLPFPVRARELHPKKGHWSLAGDSSSERPVTGSGDPVPTATQTAGPLARSGSLKTVRELRIYAADRWR